MKLFLKQIISYIPLVRFEYAGSVFSQHRQQGSTHVLYYGIQLFCNTVYCIFEKSLKFYDAI